jgi:hypothetical protein
MDLIYALLIIIIIISLLFIVYVYYFNKLQDCKLKIDEAESIIDEALRDKYDSIIAIRNLITSNIKDDKINFKGLDELKDEDISNFDLDRRLNEYRTLINKINDDYKKLDDNKDFNDLLNKLKRTDEKISAAKGFYNTYITESNELVRKYPSNLVAKFNNINIKAFFDGKDMNDDNFKDFKL